MNLFEFSKFDYSILLNSEIYFIQQFLKMNYLSKNFSFTIYLLTFTKNENDLISMESHELLFLLANFPLVPIGSHWFPLVSKCPWQVINQKATSGGVERAFTAAIFHEA